MKSQLSSIEANLLSNGHNSPEIQSDSNCNVKDKESSQGRFKSYCRIRPFDGINKTFFKFTENSREGINQYLNINRSSIKDKSLESLGSKFKFDYIFDEEFTQIEVFQETSMNLITSLVNDRKSSIIIANGLTDSGKTYTIVGDIENPGLLPLSLRFTYDQVMENKNKMIKIYCNYIEIDEDDNVYDLLSHRENEKSKVKIPNNSRLATFIESIQDCSNAINLGNKRKKMKKGHSLSTTVFKIILRFFEDSENYEEASLVLLDIAHQQGKPFENMKELNCDNKSSLNQSKSISWQYTSLCRVIKTFSEPKLKKFSHRPRTDYCNLTIIIRYYLFGCENIVLISNVNPTLEHAEDNLKVFYFSNTFKESVAKIDASYKEYICKKTTKFILSKEKEKEMERMRQRQAYLKINEEKEYTDAKEKEKENTNFHEKEKENILLKNLNDKNSGNKMKDTKEEENKTIKENGPKSPSKTFELDLKIDKPYLNQNCNTPTKNNKILTKEEKNNFNNPLKENASVVEKISNSYSLRSSSNEIFKEWEIPDNKNSVALVLQPNEGVRISNSEIERMKEDYKKLQIKFEEQEKLIKKILEMSQGSKEDGVNRQIACISHEENKEKAGENLRMIDNPLYRESLELINSNFFDGLDNQKSSSKREGKLYNIILMNPSIQNFTILNRELGSVNDKQVENKSLIENPLPKIESKEGEKENFKEIKFSSSSHVDTEFKKENENLFEIKDLISFDNKRDNSQILTRFKNKRITTTIVEKKKRKPYRPRKNKMLKANSN